MNDQQVPTYRGKPIPDRFKGGYASESVPEGTPPIDKWAVIEARQQELDREAAAQKQQAEQRSAPAAS